MPITRNVAVKIVVANTPGGPSDIVGRVVAAALEQSTGKTFIIENRGGAGGNIGMGYVARSDPDGYTILLGDERLSVNYGLYNHLPYDPYKDFVAVSELATTPNTFVVRSELPAKTIKDFIALARANPDKYNCATPIGTTPQLQLEVLKIREKLPRLEDVVFKGGGDAITALPSGTVQLSSGSLRAGRTAHQIGHDGAARGHRRGPLARSAGRAHHGGGATRISYSRSRPCRWLRRRRCLMTSSGWSGKRSRFWPRRKWKDEAVPVRLPGATEGRRSPPARGPRNRHVQAIIDQAGIKKL